MLFAVRELLYSGIRKNKSGVFEKYNTMFMKDANHNVLFLGSSRTEMHFNTQLFDSITGLNSYNIGVTGATPRIAYAVLKAYCSKHPMPKYLVFDLDYHFLKYGVDTIRNFPRYFPYLSNSVLLNGFNAIDSRFIMFKNNPVYALPFSNMRLLAASLHGWLGIEGREDTLYHKGFSKIVFRDTIKSTELSPFYAFIHPTERMYIDSIIHFTKANRIEMMLLSSPMYVNVNGSIINKPQIVRQLTNIATVNNLSYFDLSLRPYSSRKGYFADFYHMNAKGAALFTREFAPIFQQYFNKKTVK